MNANPCPIPASTAATSSTARALPRTATIRAITPQIITTSPTVCVRGDSSRWPASWAIAEVASTSAMTAPATARLSSPSTVITNEGISDGPRRERRRARREERAVDLGWDRWSSRLPGSAVLARRDLDDDGHQCERQHPDLDQVAQPLGAPGHRASAAGLHRRA